MLSETTTKNTLVPLVLRVMLGAIFLYHGIDKVVGPQNGWGATWMEHMRYGMDQPILEYQRRVDKELKPLEQSVAPTKEEIARIRADQSLSQAEQDEKVQALNEKIAPQNDKIVAINKALDELKGKAAVLDSKLLSSKVPEHPKIESALQVAVAWGELLGGIALILGILTRIAALGEILIQLGAIALVTAELDFSRPVTGGWAFNVALIASCLCLVMMGPGTLSLDYWRRRRDEARRKAAPPAGPPPATTPPEPAKV